jgi:hypothetical protein
MNKDNKMKKGTISIIVFLLFVFFAVCGYSQEAETDIPPQAQDENIKPMPTPPPPLKLGRIYFPQDFLQANKDYKKGVYLVTLISKEEIPYFQISDRKGDLLFEEMAVVKSNKLKSRSFRYRVRKEILRGYEYFRIRVTKPGQYVMAYFKLKEKEKAAEKKEEQAEKEGNK